MAHGARAMRSFWIAFPDPFRPFVWQAAGRARGTFVRALTKRLPRGVQIIWISSAHGALPALLLSGEIDAIAPLAITRERCGLFAFSEPLMQTAAALFARAGEKAPHPSTAGLARIVTPRAGPLAALLRALAPAIRLNLVADYEEAFACVLARQADYAALNAEAGTAFARRLFPGAISAPGPRFAPVGLAVATLPGDPQGIFPELGLTHGVPL